ncbi:WAT1-related protein At1g09380-like [Papaver somniferum]|uniref:WAT1-related protein At1g09380-like n=1 Tax=Papaver somniferum TaxID=3469 RepID=UPI000E6FF62C|nr:WAT1-related protein At1g09380-like [Papaver somniferum]
MIMSFLRGPMLIRKPDLTWKALRRLLRGHHHSSTEVSWLGNRRLLSNSPDLRVPIFGMSSAKITEWGRMSFSTTHRKVAFSAPYATTCLMSLLASVQLCVVAMIEVAISANGMKAWRFGFDVGLLAILWSGLAVSGLSFVAQQWCIAEKGATYVVMFSPLVLILVSVVDWLLLDESLYLGGLMGAILIVFGLILFNKVKGVENEKLKKKLEHDLESGERDGERAGERAAERDGERAAERDETAGERDGKSDEEIVVL